MGKISVKANKEPIVEIGEDELLSPTDDVLKMRPFAEKVLVPLIDALIELFGNMSFRKLYESIKSGQTIVDDVYKICEAEFWNLLLENRNNCEDVIKSLDGDYFELTNALDTNDRKQFFSVAGKCSLQAQSAKMFFQAKNASDWLIGISGFLRCENDTTITDSFNQNNTDVVLSPNAMQYVDDYIDDLQIAKDLSDNDSIDFLLVSLVEKIFMTAFVVLDAPRNLFSRRIIYKIEDILNLKHIQDKNEKAEFENIIQEINKGYVTEIEQADYGDYSAIIEKWRNCNINEQSYTFSISPMLNDSQIEALIIHLGRYDYIPYDTTISMFKHVLGGLRCDDYRPIIWIKKTSKGIPSKVSLLNFLRLLGVDWTEFSLKRLNYCFVCPTNEGKYIPFGYNNIKNKKGVKTATSEFNNELRTILMSVLGSEHIICKRWDRLILDE